MNWTAFADAFGSNMGAAVAVVLTVAAVPLVLAASFMVAVGMVRVFLRMIDR